MSLFPSLLQKLLHLLEAKLLQLSRLCLVPLQTLRPGGSLLGHALCSDSINLATAQRLTGALGHGSMKRLEERGTEVAFGCLLWHFSLVSAFLQK